MTRITNDNWVENHYKLDDLSCFISFGVEPQDPDNYQYFVTVMDEENRDIHQTQHAKLEQAVDHINSKCAGLWELQSKDKKQGSGCDSCAAH